MCGEEVNASFRHQTIDKGSLVHIHIAIFDDPCKVLYSDRVFHNASFVNGFFCNDNDYFISANIAGVFSLSKTSLLWMSDEHSDGVAYAMSRREGGKLTSSALDDSYLFPLFSVVLYCPAFRDTIDSSRYLPTLRSLL